MSGPRKTWSCSRWRSRSAPGLNTLCDFSAGRSAPSLTELREIVALINRYAAAVGNKKLAMIATMPIVFGAARQFQALAEASPIAVKVFTDRGAAIAWLRDGCP